MAELYGKFTWKLGYFSQGEQQTLSLELAEKSAPPSSINSFIKLRVLSARLLMHWPWLVLKFKAVCDVERIENFHTFGGEDICSVRHGNK